MLVTTAEIITLTALKLLYGNAFNPVGAKILSFGKELMGVLTIKVELDIVDREYVYSAVVYQKYLTRLRELIIFEPWRENDHFSQPS